MNGLLYLMYNFTMSLSVRFSKRFLVQVTKCVFWIKDLRIFSWYADIRHNGKIPSAAPRQFFCESIDKGKGCFH